MEYNYKVIYQRLNHEGKVISTSGSLVKTIKAVADSVSNYHLSAIDQMLLPGQDYQVIVEEL